MKNESPNIAFFLNLTKKIIARTDKEIDTLVYELYGLTDEEIRIVEGEK